MDAVWLHGRRVLPDSGRGRSRAAQPETGHHPVLGIRCRRRADHPGLPVRALCGPGQDDRQRAVADHGPRVPRTADDHQDRYRGGGPGLPLQHRYDHAQRSQDRGQHGHDDRSGRPGGVLPVLLLQPGKPGARQVLLVVRGAPVGGRRVGTDHGFDAGLRPDQDHRR
ncbi:hypothetical protein D3C77_592810 [compost metagenome]